MIPLESLERFSAEAQASAASEKPGDFDMEKFLKKNGLTVLLKKPWSSKQGGEIYKLDHCPFDPGHTRGSAAFTLVDGKPGFKCQHLSCTGKDITSVLSKYPAISGRRNANPSRSGKARQTRRSLKLLPPSSGEQIDTGQQAFGSFRISDEGVFFVSEGSGGLAQEVKLAARVDVVAETRDASGKNWGRLLTWRDNEGREHQWPMPMEALSSDAAGVRARLLGDGLPFINTNARWRERFAEYLQTAPANRLILCTSRVGWHEGVYTLPDESFGLAVGDEVLYQASADAGHNYKVRGSAEDWRIQIGEKCAGNSRLVLAVSCAFAGPLLAIAGAECGGIHLYGATSTGKSTTLLVGGSVGGGGPNGSVQNWRSTVNGLESVAEAHNDRTLYLDELAQVDPREAAEACYLLANGQGKSRMNKALSSSKKLVWRILFVSAGELTLAEHVASAGKRTTGGAEVRLLNIRADAGKGLGLLEELHGAPTPEIFIRQLREAASLCYGGPFRQYLRKLVGSRDFALQSIGTARANVLLQVPSTAAGEIMRAADRFALIGAAGELATEWGLTGWKRGESIQAVTQCLHSWINTRGTIGNSDLETGVNQVRAFLGKHGASRFQRLTPHSGTGMPGDESVVQDRAGFLRRPSASEETEFLILPDVFRSEVCAGHDWSSVARELEKRGFLVRDGANLTIKPRLPGFGSIRVYCVRSAIFEGQEC